MDWITCVVLLTMGCSIQGSNLLPQLEEEIPLRDDMFQIHGVCFMDRNFTAKQVAHRSKRQAYAPQGYFQQPPPQFAARPVPAQLVPQQQAFAPQALLQVHQVQQRPQFFQQPQQKLVPALNRVAPSSFYGDEAPPPFVPGTAPRPLAPTTATRPLAPPAPVLNRPQSTPPLRLIHPPAAAPARLPPPQNVQNSARPAPSRLQQNKNNVNAAGFNGGESETKYYYPPRAKLPLPQCFHNPTGYVCCNEKLNDLMVRTYTDLEAQPKFHTCNTQALANHLQMRAEEEFGTDFETIAALEDFSQKVHFRNDLICKVELGGRYMLAYATVHDVKEELLTKNRLKKRNRNKNHKRRHAANVPMHQN